LRGIYGGVAEIQKRNEVKAKLLYDAIDHSDFYQNNVHPDNRSAMNVPFQLKNPELDELFLKEADAAGLRALAVFLCLKRINANFVLCRCSNFSVFESI